jgi:outer membrane protein assembly factor BamB
MSVTGGTLFRRLRPVLLAALALAGGIPALFAQDGAPTRPMPGIWPMIYHDGRHTGATLVPGPTTARKFWAYKNWPLLWTSGSTPVVRSDGVIYLADLGHLHAFSRAGTLLWSFIPSGGNGWIDSTPAVARDGTIYVGAWDGKLYAVDHNGKLKWSFATSSTVWVTSSPVIAPDGTIYVGGYDGYLYALTDSGTKAVQKWRFKTDWFIGSSPALAPDGTIYIAPRCGPLYAVNPSGTEKWHFPLAGGVRANVQRRAAPRFPPATWDPSPAVGPDGTVYWAADFSLYAVRPSDGTQLWKLGEWAASTASIAPGGTLYVGLFAHDLIAVAPATGTVIWRFTTANEIESSPAIDSKGRLYFGCYDNNVYALDSAGHELWRFPTGFWASVSPALDRGTLYVTSDDDGLYAIGGPAPGRPDLTSEWTRFTALSILSVSGTLTVRNIGDKAAGACKVKFYLSKDEILDAGDSLVKTVSITALAARGTKAISFSLASLTSISGKFILASVDADSVVVEADEKNNLAPSPQIK